MAFIALGTLATFAVFAATTITNVPEPGTMIGGDMGIFPGTAFTGFPPGACIGTMYSAGSYAGIVKGDAQVAYDNAASQAFTETLSNQDLAGKTLLPGVYKYDANAALSAGQLFLDANGNPDAVWIFQIGAALNIAAGTGMFFTGGVGNPNNVIWQVGSEVTLNSNVVFIGNILSNGLITCKSSASVNGRLVSLNGAITFSDNTVSFPSIVPSGQPSSQPSGHPSALSGRPTGQPSGKPSGRPSGRPSGQPSGRPSGRPSSMPSGRLSVKAGSSAAPSAVPTGEPSAFPTVSAAPTLKPSLGALSTFAIFAATI